jgi:hypothetical protein
MPRAIRAAEPNSERVSNHSRVLALQSGEEADDGSRTRDLELGKLALYQLSYVRSRADSRWRTGSRRGAARSRVRRP